MATPIKPTTTHELPLGRWVVDAAAGPNGELFTVERVDFVDLWSLLVDHWYPVMGVVCALSLFPLLFIAWRVRVRPDATADRVCRKCGYALEGDLPERCPECGRGLDGKRATRRGRSFLRRMRLPVAACLVLWATLLGTPGVLLLFYAPPPSGNMNEIYAEWLDIPSVRLLRYAEENQTTWLMEHRVSAAEVHRRSLTTGRSLGRLLRVGVRFRQPVIHVSEDGSLVVLEADGAIVAMGPRGTGRAEFSHERPLGSGSGASTSSPVPFGVAGVSRDGSSVYVAAYDGTGTGESSLWRWQPVGGKTSEIVRGISPTVTRGIHVLPEFKLIDAETEQFVCAAQGGTAAGELLRIDGRTGSVRALSRRMQGLGARRVVGAGLGRVLTLDDSGTFTLVDPEGGLLATGAAPQANLAWALEPVLGADFVIASSLDGQVHAIDCETLAYVRGCLAVPVPASPSGSPIFPLTVPIPFTDRAGGHVGVVTSYETDPIPAFAGRTGRVSTTGVRSTITLYPIDAIKERVGEAPAR